MRTPGARVLRFPLSDIEEVVVRLLEEIRAGKVQAVAFVAAKGNDSWTFFGETKPNHVAEVNLGLDLLKRSLINRVDRKMEDCPDNKFEQEDV
jgi:hypothetical protein